MLGIVLLIMGIVFATRIPKLLKSTPAEFPGCDPNLHARWRAKELGSIYVFLGATWGQVIVFFCLGLAIGLMARDRQSLESTIGTLTAIEIAVFLGGLIWAAVLGSQASKLKKQLGMPQTLPPGYYPRPGQPLMPMPPAEPPAPGAPPPATAEPPPDSST